VVFWKIDLDSPTLEYLKVWYADSDTVMKSRLQKWRIRISVFAGVIFFAFASVTTSRWEEQAPLGSALLFFLGLVLIGLASLGRLWCSLYIAGYKTRRLVTEGPYSLSRNPLYFFSLVGFIGVGLASETLLLPAVLVLAFVSYYPAVIRAEEKKLRAVHSEAYGEYAKSTPCFFPALLKLTEPETYDVNPRVFRRHLLDALLFVWCAGVLELLEKLRDLGWITGLLTTY
jgi:protein-S-isoprenylcysteine O-methyltransferase Ste14